MTPKQQYEARKAERKLRDPRSYQQIRDDRDRDMELMLERFVVAVERIADAADRAFPGPKS